MRIGGPEELPSAPTSIIGAKTVSKPLFSKAEKPDAFGVHMGVWGMWALCGHSS